MSKVVVLDYGSSNLRSVEKALETVSDGAHTITVSNKPETILTADKVVFPGQGAIGQAMSHLKEQQLDEVVKECILNKPFLGICLGLQMLMEHSEEDGGVEGLGILPGNVVRFKDNEKDEQGNAYKIPSMGWNKVFQTTTHPLWQGIEDGSRFYFVHSYYVAPADQSNIATETEHGNRFCSMISRGNLFATQFHPEKSQSAGLRILKNFASL